MYEYRVKKLVGVVDGDTIDVDIDLGFNVSYSQRVRLAGIDTPESRTKDKFEKTLGLEAKEYIKTKLKDASDIIIKTELPDSSEKYGRILGWVYVNGQTKSINEEMIEDGYAWHYMGETKVKDFAALAEKRKKSGK
ncbi:MAG: nuclease [Alphaproteobacteria bacterium]|jgi:micrococcal nuclease|nr:nuclease [Alphaproteobacteria bacterium]